MGVRAAGEVLGVPRALTGEAPQVVLGRLHAARVVEKAPAAVAAPLLEDGIDHGALRTMDRLWAREGEGRERRGPRRRGHDCTPALLAPGPNPVGAWDITKLKGPVQRRDASRSVILAIARRDGGAGWSPRARGLP